MYVPVSPLSDGSGREPEVQSFEWGSIRWIHDSTDFESGDLLVGHVTFNPHTVQTEHHHTGDEQLLYVISGKGFHSIDGVAYELYPGQVHHISPFVAHSLRNDSDETLEMIIVYHTNKRDLESLFPDVSYEDVMPKYDIRPHLDTQMVQNIQDKLSTALGLSIAIYDHTGELLTEPSNIPGFCKKMNLSQKVCPLYAKGDFFAPGMKSQLHYCHFDLVKITAPIIFSGRYMGGVFCGPVILHEHSAETMEKLRHMYPEDNEIAESYLQIPKITKGRLQAVIDSVLSVNDYIVEKAFKEAMERTLALKTADLLQKTKESGDLEQALMRSQIDLLKARMSPHFLFNTLGVIGQLAYMNGAKEAAEISFALTNMLRTSLKEAEQLIPVAKELAYVRDYILIQNKRVSPEIKLEISADDGTEELYIPFLLLQTFVENSIKHGIDPARDLFHIRIGIRLNGGSLTVSVADDGRGMRPEVLQNSDLNPSHAEKRSSSASDYRGLGISNILKIMKYHFNSRFTTELASAPNKGTLVKITLPIRKEGNGDAQTTGGG